MPYNPNMRVLVVDDFSTMRRIIKNILRQLGFTNVVEADDGTTAAAGNYKFTVEAAQGGKPVNVGALQLGMVSALVRSGNSFLLDLGSLGRLDFKDVQQII